MVNNIVISQEAIKLLQGGAKDRCKHKHLPW